MLAHSNCSRTAETDSFLSASCQWTVDFSVHTTRGWFCHSYLRVLAHKHYKTKLRYESIGCHGGHKILSKIILCQWWRCMSKWWPIVTTDIPWVILELPTKTERRLPLRDPLVIHWKWFKKTIVDAGFADAEVLKDTEKRIWKQVQNEVIKAKESPKPPHGTTHDAQFGARFGIRKSEYPPHIWMPNYAKL